MTLPIKSLDQLNLNQKAEVSHVHTEDRQMLKKIIAMGVLSKAEVVLVQKFPSFVFRVDNSFFAIDKELASCIYVKSF